MLLTAHSNTDVLTFRLPMCQFNSYRPGDSTYEALAPRRPRSIHKIQIKIIYRRREYRGVWVGGCGAPSGGRTGRACVRECGASAACSGGQRDAWRLGRGGGDGRVRRAGERRGRRAGARSTGAKDATDATPAPLAANTHYSITTTCMQWSLQVKPDSVSSVLSFIWFMIYCVMLRVVRWGEAFRIYFARSFRIVYMWIQ